MQRCQIPEPLKPGDRLWVIMPSGALREGSTFEQGIELWRSRGYQVDLHPDYNARWGYLAGTDEQRRAGLLQGLEDPSIKGILCGRGGYGGARLLEDFQWPDNCNKWLIGFSDITSLLWGLSKQGISGIHGPVLTTISDEPEWSLNRLWDWVEGKEIPDLQGQGWNNGNATGKLLPCNLTVGTHLLNTEVAPDLSDIILAIEDVGETPYRIDRMLTQWRMTGALSQVKGIAIGRFSQAESPSHIPSFTMEEVFRDRLSDLDIPIVTNLPFGHDGENAILPVGVDAILNSDTGTLSIHRPE